MSRFTALVGMLFLAGAAPLGAQDSATVQGTATARIISGFLEISSTTDIVFGAIGTDGSVPGTVKLTTSGDRIPDGGARLLGGGNEEPATFVVTGPPRTKYLIILPDPADIVIFHDPPTATTLVLKFLTSRSASIPDADGTIGVLGGLGTATEGTDTVFVGGTVTVPTDTVTGRYFGEILVTFGAQ